MSEFHIGPWRVQPSLNRLSRGSIQARLEPKLMDVLCALHRRKGEVVSKEQLIDTVWPETFVTESVVTRAIAGLRKAMRDNRRRPRFIETISKRGYRLVTHTPALPDREHPNDERTALIHRLGECLLRNLSSAELRDLNALGDRGDLIPLRRRDISTAEIPSRRL